MIKINLEDTYEIVSVNQDLSEFMFRSVLKNNDFIDLYVRFSPLDDPLLPNVYNMAFGPLENNSINDAIKLHHNNLSKVLSTVVFCAITFLDEYKNFSVGIDGSNESRAYLYHRMFSSNKDELSEIIITIGVDWYVRLLRNNDIERDYDGLPYFKPKPEPFNFERPSIDLYRYYLIESNNL